MKEIRDIITAFEKAQLAHTKTALATVVQVEGSSYRRPGARMLVTEEGMLTGAISGGCLEGDALKKALLAINQQEKKLVVYDTTDEDDAKLGIQLGCNGIVSILFEPVDAADAANPIQLLKQAIAERKPAILISGYSLSHGKHTGTCRIDVLEEPVQRKLKAISRQVMTTGVSVHTEILMDHNLQEFYVEYIEPPIALLVIGAGNDAIPMAAFAAQLGWSLTIADGRKTHATGARFPAAETILVGKPEEVLSRFQPDERTAAVLMTHNYNYDLAMLRLLIDQPLPYIGLLGPASKRERMLQELESKGLSLTAEQLHRIYGPTGLDLGSETAAEIALSVTAEIMCVLQHKEPIHLKTKLQAIHHSGR